VNRPGHNGTYVSFNDATLNGTIVLQYDCGWSPNVNYIGSTIVVNAQYSWTPGHHYYVTFDSGLHCYIEIFINFFLSFFFKEHRAVMISVVS
jgi:hypothetical protein